MTFKYVSAMAFGSSIQSGLSGGSTLPGLRIPPSIYVFDEKSKQENCEKGNDAMLENVKDIAIKIIVDYSR
jgi:hypothetical protein